MTTIPVPAVKDRIECDYKCELPTWLQQCLRQQWELGEEDDGDNRLMANAFQFAYDLHGEQVRKSGEPYICHPIAVAGILRELGAGATTIAAGFLHDVVEDTAVSIEEISERFGPETAHLVEGVTKLSKFNFSSKKEQQAENFRRMFVAMAQDINTIVVKLADRLHNMSTLEHLREEKQKSISQETRDIFAPLANRLGLGRIKWELEDLSFKYLEPEDYRRIQDLVAEKRNDREARIANVTEMIRHRLDAAKIKFVDVSGRPKHLYGIYQKMRYQKKEFHEIFDLTALRIIVENNQDCYLALAQIHDVFRPIPGRFKDYIGLPKSNRYQSLHTTVVGFTGTPLEVQIRTVEMHRVAEYGIAAHWKYKETAKNPDKNSDKKSDLADRSRRTDVDEKFTWLRQLLEWQSDVKDAIEFDTNLKDHLLERDVYAFTPKGEVVSLRQGATAVDFAYRIHTEVGNHCAGAKVNDRIVPLSRPLENGDIVEIITRENSHPSLDWLNFVVTPGARNRISQWYKRSHRDENIARGREVLEKELGKTGLEALLKSERMHAVANRCNYPTVDDLLAALGYGEVTQKQVVNRLQDTVKDDRKLELLLPTNKPPSQPENSEFPIHGIEGLLHHIAGCCNPIPGEGIVGVVTRNSGISIHRQGCSNLETIPGERLLPVSWNVSAQQAKPRTYCVNVQIEVFDRVGVLKDILSRLSDNKVNVQSAKVITRYAKPATIDLSIEVADKAQLERCFAQIKQMTDVLNIRRLAGE